MFQKSLKTFIAIAAIGAASFSVVAKADQWTEADALFAEREDDRAKIAQARAKYVAILDTATAKQDKIRAAVQIGRLAAYEGEMLLPKSAKAEREEIFGDCWRTHLEKISPAAVGEKTPEYYYYKGACLAWWSEAVGTARALLNIELAKRILSESLALDTRFEGGGAHRLAAGVKSNPAARPLPGLYDIAEAEEQIYQALDATAYPGDANNGKTYYENMRGIFTVLVEAGKKDQAKAKAKEFIGVMERAVRIRRLPKGREAESRWVLAKLKVEVEALDQ